MSKDFYPSKVILMTPQIAKQLLQKNTINRKLRENHVRFLAAQMVKGQWRVNPSCPIVVAKDKTIIDGQHRLHANIKAAIPVYMCIMYDVDKDDRFVVDTGIRRNGGDTLSMEGIPQAANLASLVKSYLSMKRGLGWVSKGQYSLGVSNLEITEEFHKSEDFYRDVLTFARVLYKKGIVLSVSSLGGTFCYLVKEKGHSPEKVKRFFEELTNGGGCNVISYVRNKYIKSMRCLNRADKLTENEKMVLLSKAWNAFLTNENKKIMRLSVLGKPIFK